LKAENKSEKIVEKKEEPTIVLDEPKSEKSFFEIMWERDHPEEVKKLALAEEQK
jgi:hypothetical protein